MSISADTAAPTGPSVSSPMRPISSFSEWLSGIVEWIRSLSPAGATKYDTGWVNVTPRSGFFVQVRFQVRRIGKVVYLRGGFSNAGMAPNANLELAQLPTEFVPPVYLYIAAASSMADEPGRAEIRADGSVWVRTGQSLSPYYMYDGITWTAD